jgi:hypothetical protein
MGIKISVGYVVLINIIITNRKLVEINNYEKELNL